MSLPTRRALPPCCASWTANCCRTFSSSSAASAAAQTKPKPRVYQTYTQSAMPSDSPMPSRTPFSRDPPMNTSYVPRTRSVSPATSRTGPGSSSRPAQGMNRFGNGSGRGIYQKKSSERTGVNKLGSPDNGWGPRRPLPTIRIGRTEDERREGWSALGLGRNSRSANPPIPTRRRDEQTQSGRMGSSSGSYVEKDVVAQKGASVRKNDFNHRLEREKHRREEESLHDLRLSRELRAQRAQVESKVQKGVAKLKEFEKIRDVYLGRHIKVGDLARLFGVRLEKLQATLDKAGCEEVSYDHLLNSEDAALLAPEFNCNVIIDEGAAFDIQAPPLPADASVLPPRPPVVTIMGHVDHGKTTLLDTLRNASVATGEAGGITQHIGAFTLPVSSLSVSKGENSSHGKSERMITFLDTPGHAAFSAMRARGAMVTDVVVLVVAADDGVMPQTKEVIHLVNKERGHVGLVVAINKVDKPGADPMTVKQMLFAEGVQLEEFGGDVPAVEVSGLTGKGLDTLMETVSLVAELMDVRAEEKGMAVGYVLESKVAKGFGPVATVLLLRGELTVGSHLISGTVPCRVRSLTSSNGQNVKSIPPGTAASVSGWKELPSAGDQVLQAKEEDIKRALVNRKRNADIEKLVEDVEAINEKRREERERREQELEEAKKKLEKGELVMLSKTGLREAENADEENGKKELRLVIKADVSGSAEAVAGALEGIGNMKAGTKIISYGVGAVTEGDVTLAKAIGASIVAFNTQCPRPIAQMAHTQNVPVISSDIIYRLMETVQQKVIDLLPPVIEYKVLGEATVQQMFEIDLGKKNKLKVAGCRVSNGTLEKNKSVRLVRNGKIVHQGTLDTFKHMKKDIAEARKGMECGLSLSKYEGDFKSGDVVQMYETISMPGSL